MKRLITGLVAAATIGSVLVVSPPDAEAYKPYTHVQAGRTARADAIDDGRVSIAGRSYPVNPTLVAALKAYPSHYRAGALGPDAYPDMVMGQGVIHPENSGAWLDWVLRQGWAAQDDRNYSAAEKGQILAFSYGFLTHAAGDVWAHTFVNEFAEGVFPDFTSLTEAENARIALRHIIVEGYVEDASRGFDGNPNRTLINGTISDDSTPTIGLASPPDRFIWETFLIREMVNGKFTKNPVPGQPTGERGPLIDAFFDLYNATVKPNAATIPEAILCVLLPYPANLGPCKQGGVGNLEPRIRSTVRDAYSHRWAKDILYGLQHWSQVGATFAVMFDPGWRRAAQDAQCRSRGSEQSRARIDCENGIGIIDAATYYADRRNLFTTGGPRLLSMLGVPDWVLRGADQFEVLLEFIDVVTLPRVLREALARAERAIKDYIAGQVSEAIGFDVVTFQRALKEPTTYLDNGATLPAVFGRGRLFEDDARERIDEIMGINPAYRNRPGRLNDAAVFSTSRFAPYANTVTMSKMVLLDGPTLDRLLSDLSGTRIRHYSSGGRVANVMTTGLTGQPWLRNMDSDHQWRRDGRFGDFVPPQRVHGGTGRFPIWESCAMRPAFRQLFTDWQNGDQNFPDLGDGPSRDAVNALPQARVRIVETGSDPRQRLFRIESDVRRSGSILEYRINRGGWTAVRPNAVITFNDAGSHTIEARAKNPCTAERRTSIDFVNGDGAPRGERPQAPTNVRALKYSPTTAELLWNRAVDPDGIVVGYKITRNQTTIGTFDRLNFRDRSLQARLYTYRIVAVDNDGNESEAATVRLDMRVDAAPDAEGQAPNPPTNLRGLRYSATSGEVLWDRATDPDGIVVGYRISRNGTNLGQRDALNVSERNLPTRKYTYLIVAVDNDGNVSEPASVTLDLIGSSDPAPPADDDAAPTRPGNLRARTYSATTGELLWNRSSDADGIVVGYRITQNGRDVGQFDRLSLSLDGLTPGRYRYEVRAVDDDGNVSAPATTELVVGSGETGPPPEPTPPTTQAPPVSSGEAPTTPGNVRATRYSATSGELFWNRSTDPDSGIRGYRVIRNGEDLGVRDALSRFFGDLSSGEYTFEVRAVDVDGNESPTATVTLRI